MMEWGTLYKVFYRLRVCHNSIGDKGLCSLANALKTANSTLTHAYIWGNKIGEPTCNVSHANTIIAKNSNFIFIQAYRELLESERLLPDNTDVRPYEVDGVNYLARTD